MSLDLISKYRTELMGVAMLMVFFSHLPIPIHNPIWHFFQWNGHFGVDVFVLLSGMGLFFSFHKDNCLKNFYTKRLIRILPFYFFINILFLLTPEYVGDNNIWEVLATITTIGYWFDYGYCDWFIPHLLLMYLLFPLFYRFVKKIDTKLAFALFFSIWLVIWLLPVTDDLFYRAAYRWNIFGLGILLGKVLCDKKSIDKELTYKPFVIVALVGLLLSVYFFIKYSDFTLIVFDQPLYLKGYIYMPYFLIVIGFCYLCGVFFEYCTDIKLLRKLILGGGRIVGQMSLELYLVHIWFVSYSVIIYQQHQTTIMSLILLGALIMLSFPVAYVLHLLNAIVTKKLANMFVG